MLLEFLLAQFIFLLGLLFIIGILLLTRFILMLLLLLELAGRFVILALRLANVRLLDHSHLFRLIILARVK